MKKFVFVIFATASLSLTGCASGDSGDKTRVGEGGPADGVVSVQYDGKNLDCITWSGSHSETGLTCDFVKYHLENPANLTSEEQAELERLLEKAEGNE